MRLRRLLPALTLCVLAGCASTRPAPPARLDAEDAIAFARAKYADAAAALDPREGYPRTSLPSGAWKQVKSSDWTSGFFPGTLWQLYEATQAPALKAQAQLWTSGLEAEKTNTRTHDLGFILYCSFGAGYRLTGEERYKAILLEGARSLATRYNPAVGAIKSWDFRPGDPPRWTYPIIIDNMMNLELLFWAARNGGGRDLYDMAHRHATVSAKHHFRPDGSAFHVIDMNPETGAFVKGMTWQGYNDASAWARGQAWAVYGFTMAYRETKDPLFLETAQKAADYFIAHLPADAVPYYDFRAPGIPNEPRDASAAAVAASGLLELSTLAPGAAARRYFDAAERMLAALAAPAYLTRGMPEQQALLLHSTGNKPANSEVDAPLSYADYYFVEALMRYDRMTRP